MGFTALVLVAAGFLAPADAPTRGGPETDRERLQGTWQVVSLESEGEKGPEEVARALKYRFRGERLTIDPAEPGANQEFRYRLDPGKDPKAIDLTVTKGRDAGKTLRGIYLLGRDSLKICLGDWGRPRAFATETRGGQALIILKRATP